MYIISNGLLERVDATMIYNHGYLLSDNLTGLTFIKADDMYKLTTYKKGYCMFGVNKKELIYRWCEAFTII